MSIQHIINKNILTVDMDTSLAEIKKLFHSAGFHHLLVTEDGELVGVISDRDLFKALPPSIFTDKSNTRDLASLKQKAHQIMSRHPITLRNDGTLIELLELFTHNKVSCVPILDQDGHLYGIISWRDVLRYLLSMRQKKAADA